MRTPVIPGNVPRELDPELLAWAAGFFDGEGSTIARTDSRRSGYYQLEVIVPQSGRCGAPEVLVKFQRAMLGVGVIRRQQDFMYKWSAGGRVPAEMALGLMWPWLGSVKRAQASVAMTIVDAQWMDGARWQRSPRYKPTLLPHALPRRFDGTSVEFAWAAGFLDAEGYFGNPRKYVRKDGTASYVVRASATQHGEPNSPAEVLLRLKALLGGRIERHGKIDDHKWVLEGLLRVDWLVEELRQWLGTVKLEQATAVLDTADVARVRGDSERCKRGHKYDIVYARPDGTIHRRCNSCARLQDRAKRLAESGKARAVRDQPADATRRYRVK